jgi:hypothetical protein
MKIGADFVHLKQQQQQQQQQHSLDASSFSSCHSVVMEPEQTTPISPQSPMMLMTVSAMTNSGTSATCHQIVDSATVHYSESTTSTLVPHKRPESISGLSILTTVAAATIVPEQAEETKPEMRKKIRDLFNALIKVERSRIDPAQKEAERAQDKIPKRLVKLSDLLPSKIMQRRKMRGASSLRTELRQPSSPLGSVSS